MLPGAAQNALYPLDFRAKLAGLKCEAGDAASHCLVPFQISRSSRSVVAPFGKALSCNSLLFLVSADSSPFLCEWRESAWLSLRRGPAFDVRITSRRR